MSHPDDLAGAITLRPGATYLPETDRLVVDGIPFAIGMLADFVAALRPGQGLGPLFLERKEEQIIMKQMDVLDVQLIPMRRARGRTVWS